MVLVFVCVVVIDGDTDSPFRPSAGHFFQEPKKVTKKALLLAWPSFLGFPHFGDAPWARAERASMP